MKNLIFPLVLVAVAIVGYFIYKRSKDGEIKKVALDPEDVDVLDLPDVVSYFKSLNLDESKDKPFMMKNISKILNKVTLPKPVKNDAILILLGVYDEKGDIVNMKLLSCRSLGPNLKETFGEDDIVMLS